MTHCVFSTSVYNDHTMDMRKTNKHFREALLETVPCSVFMVNANNQIIFWNRSAEELTQYSAEEIIGLSCDSLRMTICSTQDPEIRKTFCPLLSGGKSGEVECEIQRKDGTVVPVVRRSRPVFDDQNHLIGAIEALVDVSLIKRARTEIRVLRHEIAECGRYTGLIGCSPAMRRLYHMIETVAQSDASIVIEGETGTGKEVVAKALHRQSHRADKVFLPLNCGAVPENLIEGELFGHKRGSFTGAVADRAGCFEAARGGTLFLDEIGEMPLTAQVKLLRVLQEGQITRLGESHLRSVDVRIIAASNRPMHDLVASGEFRQDLFYRLHVVGLSIPPLRDRSEDIPDLVTHFIQQFNRRYHRDVQGCEPRAMQCLLSHAWPGNVRELEHAIEHAFVVSTPDQKAITVDLLPADLPPIEVKGDTKVVAHDIKVGEVAQVKAALVQAGGNKAAAARLLGITRTGLYKKLRRLGL
jgi:two-component system, NtrC family, response regulator HydG